MDDDDDPIAIRQLAAPHADELVKLELLSSNIVYSPSPTSLTLLGRTQVAFVRIVDAGSKIVIGTELIVEDIEENGLLEQFCDTALPLPGAGAGTTPRASTTPPAGDNVVRLVSAVLSTAQKSKPIPPQLELPLLPQNAAASTNAPEPTIDVEDAQTALSPSCAQTAQGINKTAINRPYSENVRSIFINHLLA